LRAEKKFDKKTIYQKYIKLYEEIYSNETGVPQARASMLVVGKLSSSVGFIKTSAAE